MIKPIWLLPILCLISSFACNSSQAILEDPSSVKIDLTLDSTIQVKIYNLKASRDTSLFSFQNTLLGTYHPIKNQLEGISAFDSKGVELPSQKVENNYIIYNSTDLDHIQYGVTGDKISTLNVLSTGLIVKPDLVVLNSNVLLGKLNDTCSYSLRIKKDKSLKNISNSNVLCLNDTLDVLKFKNYQELINTPIIYSSKSSNQSFVVDSTSIHLSVHSPNHTVSAKELSKIVKPVVSAVLKEIDFIRPGDYNISLLFNDCIAKDIYERAALEHSHSSIYFFASEPNFSNAADSLDFANDLKETISHELLHLYTPIRFRDDFTRHFYEDSLQMSQHLWLYEGFVEYYSHKVLLDHGITDRSQFLNSVETMINKYVPYVKMGYKISLTKASKNIYSQNHLQLFYSRAAFLCFLLDIEITQLSQGEKSLFTVLKAIYEDTPQFTEDSLYPRILEQVPGLEPFINQYLVGDTYPNIPTFLSKAGLNYSLRIKKYGFHFPIDLVAYNKKSKSVLVEWKRKIPPFAAKQQLELTRINGEAISATSFARIYRKYLSSPEAFEIEYIEDGAIQHATIKPLEVLVPQRPYYPQISIQNNMTSSQERVFEQLFNSK